MPSIDILIYTATVAIIMVTIPLTIVLYRLVFILKDVRDVVDYAKHVQSLLQSWEQLPFALLKKVLELFK